MRARGARAHPPPGKIQRGFGLVQLGRVGHAFGRLGHARQAAGRQGGQGLHDRRGARGGQIVVQGRRGLFRTDRHPADQQHVARVQAGVHLHDGYPGFRVARLDGALDGRGAAPARQQAGVDIQAAAGRQVQHPLRQDQPIGRDHHDIRRDGQQLVARLGGFVGVAPVQAQAARLRDRNAGGQRRLLDQAGRELEPAPGRAVGLRQDQRNRMAGRQDGFQRKAGKIGRTSKNNAHRVSYP